MMRVRLHLPLTANLVDVSRAAEMLGLKTEALIGSLTTIEMTSLSGRVVEYTKSQAELCRDSLAQEVYTRLFNFVVSRINASLLVSITLNALFT